MTTAAYIANTKQADQLLCMPPTLIILFRAIVLSNTCYSLKKAYRNKYVRRLAPTEWVAVRWLPLFKKESEIFTVITYVCKTTM